MKSTYETNATDICIENLPLPDFNDHKAVDEYYSKMAAEFLKHDSDQVKAVGLCLKNMQVGLVAFLVDAKRQGMNIGYQVNALVNVFAQMLSNLTLAAAHDKEEAGTMTALFAQNLVTIWTRTIAEYTGNDSIDFAKFVARKRAKEGFKASALGALGYMPDNGTKH